MSTLNVLKININGVLCTASAAQRNLLSWRTEVFHVCCNSRFLCGRCLNSICLSFIPKRLCGLLHPTLGLQREPPHWALRSFWTTKHLCTVCSANGKQDSAGPLAKHCCRELTHIYHSSCWSRTGPTEQNTQFYKSFQVGWQSVFCKRGSESQLFHPLHT